jgi:phosphatidylserine decarboxylase
MAVVALLTPLLPTGVIVAAEVILALVLAWALLFFRDPHRRSIQDDTLLLAPADGRIADIETVDEKDFIGGPALRIGIFLSIFNTHINRAPCSAKVEKITYRPGKYLNAMNRLAGKVNESNNLALRRTGSPQDRLLVRQISGAIARRIVCAAREGQQLAGGERFGMITVPDRTLPAAGDRIECMVQVETKSSRLTRWQSTEALGVS